LTAPDLSQSLFRMGLLKPGDEVRVTPLTGGVSSDAYRARVDWEPHEALETRAGALLPALLLARIDGKSPVEYLTQASERETVRRFAAPFIVAPPPRLIDIADEWGRTP
jgi:hypothetical protein